MLKQVGIALVLAVSLTSAALSEDLAIDGRLEPGDLQSDMHEYYDVYTLDLEQGDHVYIQITSTDFLPGGLLIDPEGNEFYKSLGTADTRQWGSEFTIPSTGEWQFVVFQSFWTEGSYTLAVSGVS